MKNRTILSSLFLAAVFVIGVMAGHLHAAQPHMQSALKHLRGARQELEAATADKGGHRERAIGIVGRAISETEAGIEYGRR
jgi:hypothetical protein